MNKVLTEHIANPVAARISYEMQKTVGTKAFDIMTITMRSTIANRVAHSLPALLERTLLPRLTKTLTHSLTHALVPTLAITLTHSPEQDWFCNQCFYRHAHCRECHYSSQSQYYTGLLPSRSPTLPPPAAPLSPWRPLTPLRTCWALTARCRLVGVGRGF